MCTATGILTYYEQTVLWIVCICIRKIICVWRIDDRGYDDRGAAVGISSVCICIRKIICMWRIDDRDVCVCVCVVYHHMMIGDMMIGRLEWAAYYTDAHSSPSIIISPVIYSPHAYNLSYTYAHNP